MVALVSEFLVYIIKFVAMILCAVLGVFVGGKIRKNKNAKLAAENNEK